MKSLLLWTLFAFFVAVPGHASAPPSLRFERNQGQTDPIVQYLARTHTGVVFLTDSEIVFHREKSETVRISFAGSKPPGGWEAADPTGHKTNYFIGRDPQKWIHGLESFRRVKRANLYPGIDLVLYGNPQDQFEYDLVVAPGADPSQIRIRTGSTKAVIDAKSGDLVIGGIRQHKPVVYQGSTKIEGKFKLLGRNEYGFVLAKYDSAKPLVIDPVIESRDYIGGSGDDAVTSLQDFTPTGTTASIDWPGSRIRHGTDVFWGSTIFGGSGDETAAPTKGRSSPEVVCGTTTSRDLPVSLVASGGPSQYRGGASDGFCWGLTGFVATEYFGTSGEDRVQMAFVDDNRRIAIVGSTNGPDLPMGRLDGYRSQLSGGFDAFLLVFDSSNPRWILEAATYLGGTADDYGLAVVSRSAGGRMECFVAGETASSNFPLLGALQSSRSGPTDGFIAAFRIESSSITRPMELASSTLLGGAGTDRIQDLLFFDPALDNMAAVGTTSSTNLPYRQNGYRGGASDAFTFRFRSNFTGEFKLDYIGGSDADEGRYVKTAEFGVLYIAGKTASRDFPAVNAIQPLYGGGASDGFVVLQDSEGKVDFSTYFGGSGDDEILVIQPDLFRNRAFYIGGSTTSSNLPGGVRPGGTSSSRGARDGFLVWISNGIQLPASAAGGKNLVRTISVHVPELPVNGKSTVRSSDPSVLLVAFGNDFVATTAAAQDSSEGAPKYLNLECLRDSGEEAVVTVTATGYADRSMRVTCLQPFFAFRVSAPIPLLVGAPQLIESPYPAILEPATGAVVALGMRTAPGMPPFEVSITSSSPEVAYGVDERSGARSYLLSTAFLPRTSIVPTKAGNAVLTYATPGIRSATLPVQVSAFALGGSESISIAAGCRVKAAFIMPSLTTGSLVVRSLAPDTVDLSLAHEGPYAASVNIAKGADLWLRAAPGTPPGSEVRIEITNPSTNEVVRRTVRFNELLVAPSINARSTISIPLFGSAIGVPFELRVDDVSPCYSPASSLPQIEVQNSNPGIVSTPAVLSLGVSQLSLTPVAEGTATVRLAAPQGMRLLGPLSRPIEVQVFRAVPTFKDFDLGRSLVSQQWIGLIKPQRGVVTCTTSTPGLIQLSPNRFSFASTAALDSEFSPIGFVNLSLYILGLTSQGTGRITCEAPGVAPFSANVRLYPSGMAMGGEIEMTEGSSWRYSPGGSAAVDASTNVAFAFQEAFPAITPTYDLSPPGIVSLSGGPAPWLWLQAVSPGIATVTVRQPPGFVTPTNNHTRVTVKPRPQPGLSALVRLLILGNGSVTGSFACDTNPCAKSVNRGINIQLRVVPAIGSVFKGWTLRTTSQTMPSTATNFSFTVDSDYTDVTALFEPDTAGFQFLPIPPCRLVDTRLPNGPLGGPGLGSTSTRNFPIRSACGLPANSAAYSLNVTVIPRGPLGFVTVWPGGQPRPLASTLNAVDGRIKANAAIVPAGADGSIDFFATEATDVAIDVNGVFVPQGSNAAGQSFYAVTPCRIADTRVSGGPLAALASRAFTVASAAGCGVPVTATAYALNVTAVPRSALGFLTLWPGAARPTVSTLNALTGTVTANMAIVPAGSSGNISAYVTDQSEVIVDVTGYFAPPGQANALTFRPLAPCRLLDTRNANGVLGGPVQDAVSTRTFPVLASACGLPSTAKAYSVNATVVPTGALGYLTLFPSGFTRPVVSTLNAVDGAVTSNAAIIPAGLDGAISAFVTERTHLILDINGYFAP